MKTFKYILLLISVSLLYACSKMKMTFTKKNVAACYLPRK